MLLLLLLLLLLGYTRGMPHVLRFGKILVYDPISAVAMCDHAVPACMEIHGVTTPMLCSRPVLIPRLAIDGGVRETCMQQIIFLDLYNLKMSRDNIPVWLSATRMTQ